MKLLAARYVAPVGQPLIENGAVLLRGGRIEAVGRRGDLSADSRIDYGDAVICPGFVNAHAHLELSTLAGRIPPDGDFTGWLTRLVADLAKPDPTEDDIESVVRDGIMQSIRAGVTLLGDITRSPSRTRSVLASGNLRAVSFGEVIAIGTQRSKLSERISSALPNDWSDGRVRVGVSPHAPYTVEPDGLIACAQQAAQTAAPICIHLAESPEEAEFTETASGPLADHLRSLGVWDAAIPASGCRPVELAKRCGVLTDRTIAAHANYVTDGEIELLASSGCSVAYCPRTHAAFGHKPHRFRDMMRAGVNVCIGTDSLASNPSLSVLEELRLLHRVYPDIDAGVWLEMGTIHGAKALGLSASAGAISPGMPGDLVVVPIERADRSDGVRAMLQSAAPPVAVYISGVLQTR